jgi:hypothetical protein
MMAITGTFAGTGSSAAVVAGQVAVDLTFAGTATVNAQWQVDGANWRTIAAYTGSSQFLVETMGLPFRLNCSAHTNDVTYAIATR